MRPHEIKVNLYAGYKADEKPLDFIFKGKKHLVKFLIHQTYEENISEGLRKTYTVEIVEGHTFKLSYYESQNKWFLESV